MNTKCRAWDETHKEWVSYGFCLRFDAEESCQILNAFGQPFTDRTLVPVFFTGLFDRLKIGIYEGDIVRVEDTSIGVIEYSGAEFIIRTNGSRIGLNDLTPMFVEAIGNIYENPELLANQKGR